MRSAAIGHLQHLRSRVGSSRHVTILSYHSIHPTPHRYAISPNAFERQMELVRTRYVPLRLRDVPAALDAPHTRPPCVVITFDDAYTDFLEYALPVLTRLDVPATLFVPTGFIGGVNEWDRRTGAAPPRAILDEQALCRLIETGLIDVGSHTVDHVSVVSLSDQEARRQFLDSKRRLEELTGVPVTLFAYPYGMPQDFSRRSRHLLRESGYTVAVTSHWGTRNHRDDLLALRRIALSERDDPQAIVAKIEGDYDLIGLKETMAFVLRRLGRRRHLTLSAHEGAVQ